MRLWRDDNNRHVLILIGAVAMLGGCSGPGGMVDSALDPMFPPTPSEAARDAFNVYDADKRRRAVNLLSTADFGGEPEYLDTYRLLVDDKDPTVRAACLRALGRHGTPEDVSRILPYLGDPNVFVRVEAARALQRIHREDAIDPLITTLRDDTASEVRQTCASALAQYPRARVFQALVGALNDDDYAVIRQAVRSLRTLTGQQFGENGSRWLAWADEQEDLFAEKQPYYYPQYEAPPSFWDKLAFWSPDDSVRPKRPRGVEVASGGSAAEAGRTETGSGDAASAAPDEKGSENVSSSRAPEARTSSAPRTESSGAGEPSDDGEDQTARAEARADESSDDTENDAEAWRKAHPLGATDGK